MMQTKRWQTLTLIFGLLAVSTLLRPETVSASSIVVGPGGFATIQQAVNNAAPGTAILIAPGTYAENVNLATMGSAVGTGHGDLALIARDGPGSATLSGTGVKLSSTTDFAGTLVVEGIAVSSADEDAIRFGNIANLVISDSIFQTIGNDVDDNAVELRLTAGAPHVVVLNNTFGLGAGTTAALGSAFQIDATDSAAPIITFQENTVSEPDPRPLSFPRVLVTLLGAGGTVAIRDNTFSNIVSSGIVVQLGDAGDKAVTISDNLLTGLSSAAIDVTAAPGGAVDATITNNRITDVGANAIELETNTTVTAIISGNQITNATGRGIWTGAPGSVTSEVAVNIAIEGNIITRAGRDGIGLRAVGASTMSALIRNNRIDQPAVVGTPEYSGLNVSSAPSGELTLAISDNTVGADLFGRSVGLVEVPDGALRIEGDNTLSVQDNVATDNTLAGTVAMNSDPDIVARETVTPPSAAPQLIAQDDTKTAFPGEPTTIDVLANDTAGSGVDLAFVTPVSTRGASVSGSDGITYTPAAGFQGRDVVYYVAGAGSVTGVARISVSVRALPPNTPRSLSELNYLPLVGRAR